MDANTGKLYESEKAALEDGVAPGDLLKVEGPGTAIRKASGRLRMVARLKNQQRVRRRRTQRLSRRANR